MPLWVTAPEGAVLLVMVGTSALPAEQVPLADESAAAPPSVEGSEEPHPGQTSTAQTIIRRRDAPRRPLELILCMSRSFLHIARVERRVNQRRLVTAGRSSGR